MLKYHPDRYVHSRPFFQPLFRTFQKFADAEGVLPASRLMQMFNRFLHGYWNPELMRHPVEKRPENPTQMIVGEHSMFCHAAQFTLCGRNIFHLSTALRGLLCVTDVDDVLWRSIKLPYPALYLWFGPQDYWRFGNGKYFADGAYISSFSRGGNALQIFVTTQERDVDYSRPPSFAIHRDFYYYIAFEFTDDAETVGTTLQRVLQTSPDYQRGFEPPSPDAETVRLANEHGITLMKKPGRDTAQSRVVEERFADLPVFRQVLRLIVNGLCYLSSPSREVVRRYPDNAHERLSRVSPAKAQSERQRLRQEGYTEINFCGESIDREYAGVFTGRELSPHWRRGHWRNQACGPALSEHHLMWIRPTLVRKDKQAIEDTIPGHLYHVTE